MTPDYSAITSLQVIGAAGQDAGGGGCFFPLTVTRFEPPVPVVNKAFTTAQDSFSGSFDALARRERDSPAGPHPLRRGLHEQPHPMGRGHARDAAVADPGHRHLLRRRPSTRRHRSCA